jgi:hypothetical protein
MGVTSLQGSSPVWPKGSQRSSALSAPREDLCFHHLNHGPIGIDLAVAQPEFPRLEADGHDRFAAAAIQLLLAKALDDAARMRLAGQLFEPEVGLPCNRRR